MKFANRGEAGKLLGAELQRYAGVEGLIVLALPRGGIPVATEVARVLNAPMDVFVVHHLRVPGQDELILGAISSGGTKVLNYHVVQTYDISQKEIDEAAAKELVSLKAEEAALRGGKPPVEIRDRTVVLVDEGMASGATMRAAASVIASSEPRKLIVAVPASSESACADVGAQVDEIVCLRVEPELTSISEAYET